MTENEFRIFRDLIQRECGIFLNDQRKDFLTSRVEKRLSALRMKGYFNYYRHVTVDSNREELYELIDSITINETFFFRNLPQFQLLKEKALPDIINRKRRSGDLTLSIWSAGCATGEEPYSIAIALFEGIADILQWNIRIIASDISLRCLQFAQTASYNPFKLRDVPPEYMPRYFKQTGENYDVRDFIKKLVTFDYHNLKHENGLKEMDLIFCRNVMIYYDAIEQKRLISRFQNVLNPDGYLFLGHTETLYGISNGDFRFVHSNKGSAYQKVK